MTEKSTDPQRAGTADGHTTRITWSIAIALGMANVSAYVWLPFLPLYAMELGASRAEAANWMALAFTTMGIALLISGPAWGWLSDRVGRKAMFLRALFFNAVTALIVGLVTEPWQLAIALGVQGLFSGVIGTAVALASVSVPDARLKSSLSIVSGVQFLGVSLGPALGAVLAPWIGYRSVCFLAALLTVAVTLLVMYYVPTDLPRAKPEAAKGGRVSEAAAKGGRASDEAAKGGRTSDEAAKGGRTILEPLEPLRPSLQLWLAVFIVFIMMFTLQLSRLVTPIMLQDIQPDGAAALNGIAFALGGLGSAVGVFVVTGRFFRIGHLRKSLTVGCVLIGAFLFLMAFSATATPYIVGYALMSLLQGAMLPAANTLIAFNVPKSRRGTAFGMASGAQALSFIAGSAGAALFTATSFEAGYVAVGAVCLGLGALVRAVLREPRSNL